MDIENKEFPKGSTSHGVMTNLVTQKLCMQKDVGLNGNLFGGNMLAWVDESAYIFAKTRVDNEFIVTMTIDHVSFKEPIKPGDIIEFRCSPPDFKETSMCFYICAFVNGVEYKRVFEAMCVFVTVDKKGRKKKILPKEIDPVIIKPKIL